MRDPFNKEIHDNLVAIGYSYAQHDGQPSFDEYASSDDRIIVCKDGHVVQWKDRDAAYVDSMEFRVKLGNLPGYEVIPDGSVPNHVYHIRPKDDEFCRQYVMMTQDGGILFWDEDAVPEDRKFPLLVGKNVIYGAWYRDWNEFYAENWGSKIQSVVGEELCLRKTHRYVGTFKHEDEHERVGTVMTEAKQTLEPVVADKEDPCEPLTTILFVFVQPDKGREKDVKQALLDHFTAWGCAHEYDCCGCWSYRASEALRLGKGYWRVTVGSSRNY